MKNPIKFHFPYFLIYLVFVLLSILILTASSKAPIHFLINSYHHPFADTFFKYITYLGDGLTILVVAIILLFFSKRKLLMIVLSGIFSGLIAQFLKKVVYGPMARPSQFFNDLDVQLYYVPGVDLHTVFSFPSGHSTSIFALATSLVLIQKNRKYDIPIIIIAILVAYSRMYLSQHFLIDVFVGSLIGVSVSLIVFFILYSNKSLQKTGWDNSLINFGTNRN